MLDPKAEQELLARRFGGKTPHQAERSSVVPQIEDFRPELLPEPPPPPPLSRWVFLIPLAIGIWVGVGLNQNAEQLFQPLVGQQIRYVTADRGTIQSTIRVSGDTAANRVAPIRAPRVRGRGVGQLTLIKLADAGSIVTKGTVIAEFDTEKQLTKLDDQRAKVVQQEASILKTKANQEIARERERVAVANALAKVNKANLDLRTSEIRSAIMAARLKMAVDEAEVDHRVAQREFQLSERARRAELRSTEIRRDQEKIDFQRAETNIERMVMESPITGMIVLMATSRGSDQSEVANGDQVRAGTHFMNVVDTSSLLLNATVNQADSRLFRAGLAAKVHLDAYPELSYEARMTAVGSLADSSAGGGGGRGGRGRVSRSGGGTYLRNIAVTIKILDRDQRLIPDLSASADVIYDTAEDVVRVPREALFEEEGQYFAEVRNAPAAPAERRRIEVGLMNDTHAEVVQGLDEGDVLAVRPL